MYQTVCKQWEWVIKFMPIRHQGLPKGTLDDIRLSGTHKDVVHVLVLFATNAFTPT